MVTSSTHEAYIGNGAPVRITTASSTFKGLVEALTETSGKWRWPDLYSRPRTCYATGAVFSRPHSSEWGILVAIDVRPSYQHRRTMLSVLVYQRHPSATATDRSPIASLLRQVVAA
jgi:hypothetical protein